MIDTDGYRPNVGIILFNKCGGVFWGRRIGQNAWQFPQGGIKDNESPMQALYRELYEEIGLEPEDVRVLGVTRDWLRYRIPKRMLRYYQKPLCVGQKQKWYLLELLTHEQKLRLDINITPEFDSWCWVDYWYPQKHVVDFKSIVYREALAELFNYILKQGYCLSDAK